RRGVGGADPGDPQLLLAAAMDGHALADHVAVADLDAGLAAAIGHILGLAADDGEGVDHVLRAQGGPAVDAGVGDQARAPADPDLGPDDAIGPDFDLVVEFGAGVDAGGSGNRGGHDPGIPPVREVTTRAGAVAASLDRSHAPSAAAATATGWSTAPHGFPPPARWASMRTKRILASAAMASPSRA